MPTGRVENTGDQAASGSISFSDRKRVEQLKNVIRGKILHDRAPVLKAFEQKKSELNEMKQAKPSDEQTAETEDEHPETIEQKTEKDDDKKLPASDFLNCLTTSSGVTIADRDAQLIISKFGDYRGLVNFRSFYRFLDVLPPADHTDPELFKDRLPQPFRMLAKILEENIVDAAWDKITKRNPLALRNQDEDGEEDALAEGESDGRSGNSKYHGSRARKLHRRGVNQAAIQLEEQKRKLQSMAKRKQRARVCSQYFAACLDSYSCSAELEGFAVVGTKDGRVAQMKSEATVFEEAVSGGLQVFEDGDAVRYIKCVSVPSAPGDGNGEDEADTDLYIVAVSSGFSGGQDAFAKLGLASDETSMASKIRLLRKSPTKAELELVGQAAVLPGADIVDLWISIPSQDKRAIRLCLLCREAIGEEAGEGDLGEEARVQQLSLKIGSLLIDTNNNSQETQQEEQSDETSRDAPTGQLRIFQTTLVPEGHASDFLCAQFVCQGKELVVYRKKACAISLFSIAPNGKVSTMPMWMPSGIMCHGHLVTSKGIEFAVFGLLDGCTIVWNVRTKTMRAILRQQANVPVTTVFMRQVQPKGPDDAAAASSESSVQVLCGCADGKVRVHQLTSDAPSSAANAPRPFEDNDEARPASPTFKQETRSTTLTGSVFLSEMAESVDEASKFYLGSPAPAGSMRDLRPIPVTPLWVAIHSDENSCRLLVFDIDAAQQVGQLCPGASKEWDNGIEFILCDDAVVVLEEEKTRSRVGSKQMGDEACQDNNKADTDTKMDLDSDTKADAASMIAMTARSFSLAQVAPSLYPPIAQACGISSEELGASGPISKVNPNLKVVRDTCRHLISESSAQERCNPLASLAHLVEDGMTSAADMSSPSSSPLARMFSPKPGGACLGLGVSFSRAGLIMGKLRRKREQAKKNVSNPARLPETLLRSAPSQKLSDFEERRKTTRETREAALQAQLTKWAALSPQN